jgi:signal transduction histidine kinase
LEDPVNARIESLLRVGETSIGDFNNMIAARDGSLWIAGTKGFAKSPRPHRNLQPGENWESTGETPTEFHERSQTAGIPASLRHAAINDRLSADGRVTWLATSAGLARSAPTIWEPAPSQLKLLPVEPSPAISNLTIPEEISGLARWVISFTARNGDLWLGGGNHIAWQHNQGWQVFTSTNDIGPERVCAFAESQDGRIVCATPTKVWEFDGRDWFSLRSGFDQVNDLLYARNGTLWVASNGGVYRHVRGAWVHNDVADGLPSDAIGAVRETESSDILTQTAVGNYRFDPSADAERPRTTIQPLPGGGQIREGTPLRVTFSGHDRWHLTTPERLLFSFKLDEREWSAFQDLTDIPLPELSAGRHLFLVRAMDRNANIERQPARLEFAVVLPWYRETRLVFILAIALVVALFFAGLAFNRHRQLQLSYANVERQVAERTSELERAQRELLHSQKMNALGTLSAGIAHDFNNILSIIKGSAQIIEDNTDNPEKIRTRVDRIKTVVQQGAGIVEAMLGFSRQQPGQATPCNLNSVVDDTLKLLGDRFLREVEVQFNPGGGLPETAVARDFVQQALLNFIFNAAEAMERKPINSQLHRRHQIAISTRAAQTLPPGLFLKPAPAEAFIHISVQDTGEGILPDNLPRIFEPFFTTKSMSSQRGTGLGLSMVYELARKLEAGLAVESEPGKGSTFTLILPVKAP